MKSLDYTLDKLPGDQLEIPYEKLPLSNPTPILQQPKSEITTNPFIVPSDKYNKLTLFNSVEPISRSTPTSGSTLITITMPRPVNETPTDSKQTIPTTSKTTPESTIIPDVSKTTVSSTSHENPTFSNIIQKTSITFTGILDDMYKKPDNVSWVVYLKQILSKDDRYNYVAILIFFIALYILLVK
jgi:hypothetical protein